MNEVNDKDIDSYILAVIYASWVHQSFNSILFSSCDFLWIRGSMIVIICLHDLTKVKTNDQGTCCNLHELSPINEPAHKIMALFVLLKLILQTRMCNHPVRLDVWLLVGPWSTSILYVCKQRRLWQRRLAWAFAGRQCDKYHNLMSWLEQWVSLFWEELLLSHPILQKMAKSPTFKGISLFVVEFIRFSL